MAAEDWLINRISHHLIYELLVLLRFIPRRRLIRAAVFLLPKHYRALYPLSFPPAAAGDEAQIRLNKKYCIGRNF